MLSRRHLSQRAGCLRFAFPSRAAATRRTKASASGRRQGGDRAAGPGPVISTRAQTSSSYRERFAIVYGRAAIRNQQLPQYGTEPYEHSSRRRRGARGHVTVIPRPPGRLGRERP